MQRCKLGLREFKPVPGSKIWEKRTEKRCMKTTGKLRRDRKVEPVINVFNTSFWYTTSWYTLWLVNFNSLCQPHQLLGFTNAKTKKKHSEGVDTLLYSTFRHFNICHFHTRNSFCGSGRTEVFVKMLTGSQLLFSLSAVLRLLAFSLLACFFVCLHWLRAWRRLRELKFILFLKCYWWKLIKKTTLISLVNWTCELLLEILPKRCKRKEHQRVVSLAECRDIMKSDTTFCHSKGKVCIISYSSTLYI